MRIKFIKDHRGDRAGTTKDVGNNEAFGLIDSGVAIISKDLTPDDYKQAGVNDGKPTKLRTHNTK